MVSHLFELIVGLSLALAGVSSIVQRHFTFGLFGGRNGGAGDIITINLTGKRAIFFGVFSLIGAIITILPWLYAYFANNLRFAGVLPVIAGVGVILATFGLFAGAFLQYLNGIETRLNNAQRNTDKS